MSFARIVLWASAAPFAAIGIAFLVAPARLGSFVDVPLASALADNDVRAVYGGLQLACGVLLASCARDERLVSTGLYAQLFLFGGLAFGRAVSWASVGSPGSLGLALQGGELVAIAFGVAALRVVRRANP